MTNQNGGQSVTVEFNADVFGRQLSVYQWLISTGRNPSEWEVFRTSAKIENWNPVTLGETLTIKKKK